MSYIKTIIILVFLLIGLTRLNAQESPIASGGDASGSGGSLSYSVGQLVYTSHAALNGSISQGVQQAYEISISAGIEITEINLAFSTYPNPTTNFLTLKIDNFNNEKLSFQLYDIQGKLLENDKIYNESTIISFENLASSTYYLKVTSNSESLKTFKIIKN